MLPNTIEMVIFPKKTIGILFLCLPFISSASNDFENHYFKVIGNCEVPSKQCIAIEGTVSGMPGAGRWDIEYSGYFYKPSTGEKIAVLMDGKDNTTMKIIFDPQTRKSASITKASRR